MSLTDSDIRAWSSADIYAKISSIYIDCIDYIYIYLNILNSWDTAAVSTSHSADAAHSIGVSHSTGDSHSIGVRSHHQTEWLPDKATLVFILIALHLGALCYWCYATYVSNRWNFAQNKAWYRHATCWSWKLARIFRLQVYTSVLNHIGDQSWIYPTPIRHHCTVAEFWTACALCTRAPCFAAQYFS